MTKIYKLAFLLNIFFASLSFAGQHKVLIVNTDTAISRYEKISTEFKNTLPKNTYQWQEFNLAAHKNNPDNDLEELIQKENPDIIYCIGGESYLLSQNHATDKTLIFSAALNWRRLNIDNKTYGISNEMAPEQELTYVKMFFPEVKRIGILYNKDFTKEYVETLKKIAGSFNIEIIDQPTNNPSEINSELNALLAKVDLLWAIADPGVFKNEESVTRLLETASQQKKPVYAFSDSFIRHGAALSISPNMNTIGGQAATLLKSLKEGKSPVDRVQFPAGSSIKLNLCVFEKLKLPLTKEALSSVEQIIPCQKK